MPARSCSLWISRSSSTAMRWKSAIMPSIWVTLRRFSSTWNFFRRISVSRDFIDSYSPEVPIYTRDKAGSPVGPRRLQLNSAGDDGLTKLAFRFQSPQDLPEQAITLGKRGFFVLGLAQKGLQRLVQADRLVDLRAGTGPVGAEPDQLLHV